MKQSLFKPQIKTHRKQKKMLYFVGDIETEAPQNQQSLAEIQQGTSNFVLGGYLKFNNLTRKPDYETVHPQGMLTFLEQASYQAKKDKRSGITVFFHNLSFDGHYFKPLFANSVLRHTKNRQKKQMKDNTFYIYEEAGLKSRILGIEFRFKNGVKVELRCSYYLLGMLSLKKIGELIGENKKEGDHIHNTKYSSLGLLKKLAFEFYDYGVTDLEVLMRALTSPKLEFFYRPVVNKKHQKRFPNRTSSSAIFQKIYGKMKTVGIDLKDGQQGLNDDAYISGQNSYHGGLPLRKYYHQQTDVYHNVHHADIKSSYPTRMMKTILTKRKHGYTKDNIKTPCFEGICVHLNFYQVWEGKLKTDMPTGVINQHGVKHHPNLSHAERNIVFNKEYNFHRDVLNVPASKPVELGYGAPEGKLITQAYDCQGKIIDFIHFKVETISVMENFIKEEYAKKQKYAGIDLVMYQSSKANLNSPYGQLCTSYKYVLKVPMGIKPKLNQAKELKGVTDNPRQGVVPKTTPIYTDLNSQRKYIYVQQKFEDSKRLKDIFNGSGITSQARISLIKVILANKNSFLYADTDSIYCTDKINYPEGEQIGNDLGDWEEDQIDCFKYRNKAKQYLTITNNQVKCTIAGGAKDKLTTYLQEYKNDGHHNECVAGNFNAFNIKHIELYKVKSYLGGKVGVKAKHQLKELPYNCFCK